jgi:hypothetical protein
MVCLKAQYSWVKLLLTIPCICRDHTGYGVPSLFVVTPILGQSESTRLDGVSEGVELSTAADHV